MTFGCDHGQLLVNGVPVTPDAFRRLQASWDAERLRQVRSEKRRRSRMAAASRR